MANNNQPKKVAKYEPKKLSKQELEAKEAKKEKIVKLSIKIFAIVALVALVAGIVIGIVVSVNNKKTSFNYLEENLSKYITVDIDKIVDGYEFKNTVDKVSDLMVRNEILKLLNTFKPEDPIGNMKYGNKPVAPGDDAYIFYRGYTVDNDGNKVDFAGGSNLLPNKNNSNITSEYYELYSKNFEMYKNYISPLTIGSGSFVTGFETGIVDAFYNENGEWKNTTPSSFQKYLGYVHEEKTVVEAGDYITVKWTQVDIESGNKTENTVNFDLADEKLDETYGLTGFASKFVNAKVNVKIGDITGVKLEGKSISYTDVTVTKVYKKTTDSDLIEVSYTSVGATDETIIMVDLANTNLDDIYGAGFRAALIGKPVGIGIGNVVTRMEGESTDTVYSKVRVTKVLKFEQDKAPLTISVTFPSNYGSTELAGKEAKFDVYVFYVKKYYDVENDGYPKFDDEFITKEMNVKAETLADYNGETLAEKYEAKIRAELEADYTESVNELKEARLWEVLKEATKVKKLPSIEVDYYYDLYYSQLYSQYQQYQQYYGSAYTFDMFVKAQGIADDKTTWQDALTKRAEETVIEKLSFYYVAREENLIPTGEKLQTLCQEFRDEMFAQYLEDNKYNAEDDEDHKEFDSLKAEFDEMYTDDVVIENAQFKYAIEKLYAYAVPAAE